MILINGYAFETEGLEEISALQPFDSQQTSITGMLLVTQAQFFRNRRSYNLLVTKDEWQSLRRLRTIRGAFDFVDHEGFSWLTDAGTDDPSHAYSTGAYFLAGQELVARPLQANGYVCDNRWNVQVTFIVNARGLNSANPGLTDSVNAELFDSVGEPLFA